MIADPPPPIVTLTFWGICARGHFPHMVGARKSARCAALRGPAAETFPPLDLRNHSLATKFNYRNESIKSPVKEEGQAAALITCAVGCIPTRYSKPKQAKLNRPHPRSLTISFSMDGSGTPLHPRSTQSPESTRLWVTASPTSASESGGPLVTLAAKPASCVRTCAREPAAGSSTSWRNFCYLRLAP